MISLQDALGIVSLATMKDELRIPAGEASHDVLLSGQIHSAANFCATATGRDLADLAVLRPAIVSLCRELYDGNRELSPRASAFAWLQPFRSYKAD